MPHSHSGAKELPQDCKDHKAVPTDEDSSDDDEQDDYIEALVPAADRALAHTEAHRRLQKAKLAPIGKLCRQTLISTRRLSTGSPDLRVLIGNPAASHGSRARERARGTTATPGVGPEPPGRGGGGGGG